MPQAGAGGFGKSTKKKIDTSGGLVVPKEGKRVRTSDLLDEKETSGRQAADGAPAGFPTGWLTSSCLQLMYMMGLVRW